MKILDAAGTAFYFQSMGSGSPLSYGSPAINPNLVMHGAGGQYPAIQFRRGSSIIGQMIANTSASAVALDAPGGFSVRAAFDQDSSTRFQVTGGGSAKIGIVGQSLRLQDYYVEKEFYLLFPTYQGPGEDQRADIYFTGSIFGFLEVCLIAGWRDENASGALIKQYHLGLLNTGTICQQVTRYTAASRLTAANFALSDIEYDTGNQRWRLRIAHRKLTANDVFIRIKGYLTNEAQAASLANAGITAVYTNTTPFDAPTEAGFVPVGGIIPFLKSFHSSGETPIPDGYVECNGGNYTPPSAFYPYWNGGSGVTVPKLNGPDDADRRFLRGAPQFGNPGGALSHTHSLSTASISASGSGQTYVNTNGTQSTEALPPYYEVVYIMRVR